MFDIGWTEMLVIGVVAIVVVGPKDLPRLMRTVGGIVTKMRRMAGDFQKQFNDAIRESELAEVQKEVAQIGKLDPLKDVRKSLEPITQVGQDLNRDLAKPVVAGPAVGAAAAAKSGAAAASPGLSSFPPTAPVAAAAAAAPATAEAVVDASTPPAAEPAVATPPTEAAPAEAGPAKTPWDMLSEQERAMIAYGETDFTLGAPIVPVAKAAAPVTIEPAPMPELVADGGMEPGSTAVHADPQAVAEAAAAGEPVAAGGRAA